MAGITLAQAESQLSTWLTALEAIATKGQAYEIATGQGSTRMLRRADLGEVRQMIEFWDARVKALTTADSGGRRRTSYFVQE